MRRLTTGLVTLALWTATALTAQEPAAEALAELQGGWMVVAAEQRGRPFDAIRGGALVIERQTFYLKTAAGNEFRGEIRVDPAQSPRHLDFVHDTGSTWNAIYTVDEETLRLIYVEADGRSQRPALFATASDTAGTLIVMTKMAAR